MAKAKINKPVLYRLFNDLERQAKNGDLKRLSQNKIIALNSLINQHLKALKDKRLKEWLGRTGTRLKRYYNGYLANGFKANNKVNIQAIKRISPKLLKEFKARNLESLNLITTQAAQLDGLIKSRLWNWIYDNGDKNKLSSEGLRNSVKVSNAIAKQNKHFSFILNDQMHKMRGNLDATIAKELNAIAFIWKTRRDKRVVGNPSGLYPKPTNSKMHGDHFERANKIYFYHNTFAIDKKLINTNARDFEWADFKDGMPSIPIGCRCYAQNIYDLDEIPDNLLTPKGKNEKAKMAKF